MSKNINDYASTSEDSNSKIDAIKQLIFGDSISEFNKELEATKQDILERKKELETLIYDIKAELLQNIDNLSTDVNIRISEIETGIENRAEALDEKNIDRKVLGDLLIKLGEKISN